MLLKGEKTRQLIPYFLIFFIALAIFSYLQSPLTLPDPDSFYHAKTTVLIKEHGLIKNFPWLPFTVLEKYYIDHHFLYHIFLIPFIVFANPLIGVKIATVFFASLSITCFFWFLKKFEIKWPFFYTILLLTISLFIFRMSLAKAPALAVGVAILTLYSILKRKYWLIFFFSFFYVWLYGGFMIALIFTCFYLLASFIKDCLDYFYAKKPFKIKEILFFLFNRQNLKLFMSCFGGLILGIVINPYFPTNLSFYWYQIIKIAVFNYQKIIEVGSEWYPYNFFDLLSGTALVFILLVTATTLFFIRLKRQNKETIVLFIISMFFLLYTFKSRRNVEYFVPLAILFSAFALNSYLKEKNLPELLQYIKHSFKKEKLYKLFIIYLLLGSVFLSIRNIFLTRKEIAKGRPLSQYQEASIWMQKNIPKNSIVFHSDWSEFPLLFYYNSDNFYINGLDPTFMYEYNKDRYWQWYDIISGKKRTDLYPIIKNDFQSSYIFLSKPHLEMSNSLKADKRFEILYEDEEAKIYKLD